MSPAPYRYPDDTRPAVHEFAAKFKQTYGIDPNYLGEAGYTAANFSLAALEKAGRDLTTDSFIAAMESMKDWHDIFEGPPLSLSSDQPSCVQPVVPLGGEGHALGTGAAGAAQLLSASSKRHRDVMRGNAAPLRRARNEWGDRA